MQLEFNGHKMNQHEQLRYKLIIAIKMGLIAVLILLALSGLCLSCSHHPSQHYFNDEKFLSGHQKDRPLLETPQQVYEAETYYVARFTFDGVYYIFKNPPKDYVKYSAEFVRMP